MTHLRQTVREATVARLVAAEVLAATSIHEEYAGNITTRPASTSADTLPAICVYVGGDKATRPTETAPWDTTLTLYIDVFVTGATDKAAADARDTLCEGVEAALFDVSSWLDDYELVGDLDTRLAQGTNERVISTARITLQLKTSVERHIVAEDLEPAELVHIEVTIADTDPIAPDVIVEAEPAQE